MLILLCNDDGVRAPGLQALYEAVADLGSVCVAAPDRDQSAVSHALTLDTPLRFQDLGSGWYEVTGTPTDCINLAVNNILKTQRPNLVLAGINAGGNLGDDVTYSGTVSAAMESTILGIPAIAFSLVSEDATNFQVAAALARKLALQVEKSGLPKDTFLNVNVPDVASADELCGIRITRQGRRQHRVPIIENIDPRGRPYYWIGGSDFEWQEEDDSDVAAVRAGFVSITPLQLDLTNYAAYDVLHGWNLSP